MSLAGNISLSLGFNSVGAIHQRLRHAERQINEAIKEINELQIRMNRYKSLLEEYFNDNL